VKLLKGQQALILDPIQGMASLADSRVHKGKSIEMGEIP
jgi:hypothetical protein